MKLTDKELESIYNKMAEGMPDRARKLEILIRRGMSLKYISNKLIEAKNISKEDKAEIFLVIGWKYRQIKESVGTN